MRTYDQDEEDQEQPVLADSDLSLADESATHAGSCFTHALSLLECLSLWQVQTPDDEEDGRASREPEEWSPAVSGGVDECAGEDGCEEVTKSISVERLVRGIWQ